MSEPTSSDDTSGVPAYGHTRDTETGAAPLAPKEFLRWTWRQLTSMRTALILLFLLALGAIPGSVIPQDNVDALLAAQWRREHTTLAPIYEKLGLFSVYDSAWFAAIYLLLMISLVGCILPRTRVYLRAALARPPKTPRNLSRLPEYRTFTTDDESDAVLERAQAALRGYRVDRHDDSLSAERGYLREAGNLLFHLSVLIVLVGFASGSLLGYKGGVIVVTGGQFANVASQYDEFDPGTLFDDKNLKPFSFKLTDFKVNFIKQGREIGMAQKFSAGLDYQTGPNAKQQHTRIEVNHPLSIDGSKVYLIGHGYAPNVTVRDGNGKIAFSGPVVFTPEDSSFRSSGVIKVPDADPKQLGFRGEFYPTYGFTDATGPFSAYPDAKNPALVLLAYAGDLGMDRGVPQSVYALDTDGLKQLTKSNGKMFRVELEKGQTQALPNGLGSITFNGVDRFVKLQVSRNPGGWIALLGMILALTGLLGSLFIRPRRIWVSVRREGGRTVVEVAGLDRSSGGNLTDRVDDLVGSLEEKKA
ncbi:cytochrome c biogenesis protein ResB [Nocardioides marmorisolisilvae]|uniref:Cytochrome c biogenesis protein ResB n=1 Tax=Nocardioides marmorisolisilvae TaxID=1542737 RepID=A0A3N0E010_9ACTN|nr:cytochrome c biogenesis protein ResB [Nocardioides marmorisolisilvae]RNL81188.1 cytochrome c biogenesis protein ResB [Nocardioides marmorisolisilvae]